MPGLFYVKASMYQDLWTVEVLASTHWYWRCTITCGVMTEVWKGGLVSLGSDLHLGVL